MAGAIHQTDMFHINKLNKMSNGFVTGDYYYAIDLGRLYKATSANDISYEKSVYLVASDHDRRCNVPKINGMTYYCIDRNQLWLFDVDNTWKWLAGYAQDNYLDTGFYDGNIIFTRSILLASDDSKVRMKLYKIDNAVFGRLTYVSQPLSNATLATLDSDYIPSQDITVVLEKNDSSRYSLQISHTTGKIVLADSSKLSELDTSCKFWYIIK